MKHKLLVDLLQSLDIDQAELRLLTRLYWNQTASGVKISELEQKVNTYLMEMSWFLWENSLLISALKSSVTLFTLDPVQANTRPKINIADLELPLVRSPKILGVYLDTFFSFSNHCVQVANRVS